MLVHIAHLKILKEPASPAFFSWHTRCPLPESAGSLARILRGSMSGPLIGRDQCETEDGASFIDFFLNVGLLLLVKWQVYRCTSLSYSTARHHCSRYGE